MGEKTKNYTMKYLFSTDNTNLIITLDTESGKYNPEITTINDPNITLENDRIWFFENGKYIRNFSFDHIGTISGVTPTSIADAFTKLNVLVNKIANVLQVNTYLELIEYSSNVNSFIIIKVLNDENKGMTNTIYHIYPDGTRMWIAAVED